MTIPPATIPVLPWLGDGEVLVHIGVHKTGTTAVQSALAKARPALRAQGVRYPGTGTEHFVATNAFLGKRRGTGWSRSMSAPGIGAWTKLRKEVQQATDERVVLSSESLCEANPDQIRAFVDEFAGRPLRVIATFRPLETLMPSTWQQYLKTGHTFTFDDWLGAMLTDPIEPKSPTPSFWTRNDHPAVLERWMDVVGADRVAALVIDPDVRSMLFDTVEDVIGLTRGTLTADSDALSNRGLSAEEAEFVRRLNAALDRNLDFRHYHLLVRRAGLLDMVEQRVPGPEEHRIDVPPWAVARAREIGSGHIDRLRALGVTVFGDLAHLVPSTPAPDEDRAAAPTTAATAATAPTMVPIDAAVRLLRGTLEQSVATIEHLEGAAPTTTSVPVASSAIGIRAWIPPVLIPRLISIRRAMFRLRRRVSRSVV